MEKKVTVRSKLSFWKIGLQLILLALLTTILYQNSHPVDIELLLWEVKSVPLVFLLLGTTILGALLTFLTVLWKGW